MSSRAADASSALLALADDARALFGQLTLEELNWRQAPARWSVAQCFEHLITTQSHYLPLLARLAAGTAKPTTWERFSPLSGLFGKMLIRSLDPANRAKTKTTATAQPPGTPIDDRVIARFSEHQRELVRHLEALPPGLDPRRVTVTSPLSSFVTYSLEDCFTILVVHGRRHFAQAERVLTDPGFPGGNS